VLWRRDCVAIAEFLCDRAEPPLQRADDEDDSIGHVAGEPSGRRSYAPPALGEIEARRDPLPPPPLEPQATSRLIVTNLGTLLDVLA
jgi:hypothetical protein